MVFTPGSAGVFPDPPYPRWARQQGMQGKLQLLVDVAPSGAIADLKVRETSGHDLLDKHVLDWVKANWSWAPGAHRLYLVPFVFELQ
jgi:protein TonB